MLGGAMSQALVFRTGGREVAALARALGRPAVVLQAPLPPPGSLVTVDGTTGTVHVGLLAERIQQAQDLFLEEAATVEPLDIFASESEPREIAHASASGAAGVGLFRSEEAYLDDPLRGHLIQLLATDDEQLLGK